MFQYRQVLVRLRQGDSDRDIARSRLMGRKKLSKLRERAAAQGWLDPAQPLPDDAALASALTPARVAATTVSTLVPFTSLIRDWCAQGIQGTTMHAVLCRNHGYTGRYSAMRRFLQQLATTEPVVCTTMRLDFSPAEAAQVDFGAGPTITDVHTGEVFKTWVFVMTLCWSRHQYAEVVRDQTIATHSLRSAVFRAGSSSATRSVRSRVRASPIRVCSGPTPSVPKDMASRSAHARREIRRRRASSKLA